MYEYLFLHFSSGGGIVGLYIYFHCFICLLWWMLFLSFVHSKLNNLCLDCINERLEILSVNNKTTYPAWLVYESNYCFGEILMGVENCFEVSCLCFTIKVYVSLHDVIKSESILMEIFSRPSEIICRCSQS